MRCIVVSVTGTLAVLVSVSVGAQTAPPPDSVTEVLRQKARPEATPQGGR
jgi:hypothetical protein